MKNNKLDTNKRKKLLTLVCVLILFLFGALIFLITLKINGSRPLGWDAPYYIVKDRILFSQGFGPLTSSYSSFRIGYAMLSVSIHFITNLSFILIERILPYIILTCLGLISFFITKNYVRNLGQSLAGGLLMISFYGLNWMVLFNTSDNLLAYTFFNAFVLWVTIFIANIKKRSVLFSTVGPVLIICIGFTHLETFFLTICFILLCVFLFNKELLRNIRKSRYSKNYSILALLILVSILLIWRKFILSWLNFFFIYSADQRAISSVTTLNFIKAFWANLSIIEVAQVALLAPFILFGIAIIFNYSRKKTHYRILVAWLLSLIIVFLVFSIFRYNFDYLFRTFSFLPIGIIIIIGLSSLTNYVSKNIRIIAVIVLLLIQLVSLNVFFTKNKPFFRESSVIELETINKYLIKNPTDDQIIVSVATTENQIGEFAYFGMWNHWILSSVPLSLMHKTITHFGDPSDVINCKKTEPISESQIEFSSVSTTTINNICSNKAEKQQIFVLHSLNPYFDEFKEEHSDVIELSSDVIMFKNNR